MLPNFANRTIWTGDNLPIMRGLNTGSVHLIATDPPFNKGRDFHATPDSLAAGAKFQDRWSWEDDVEGDWVDQITDDWPHVMNVIYSARESYGDDMGAFLCFMGVRLIEMWRVLRDDGSLYLHCDPTASHYLKQLLDAIFGRKNFRNEIIWHYRRWTGKAKRFQRLHDVVFFYSKSDRYEFNQIYTQYTSGSKERKEQGVLHRFKKGEDPHLVSVGEVDKKGVSENDVWQIPFVAPSAKERLGFPTQKPLALYERIIKASSKEGDWVLDPFAGCATTCVAAERLGRKWVGIDLWDGTHQIILDRLKAEGLAGPDGDTDRLFTFGDVTYTDQPPERTDKGESAAPFLQVTERYAEPDGPKLSRAEMLEHLVSQYGCRCQGCDRGFDDVRYLQLDHNTPRADGGLNHITNRVLLCGPCNQLKSHRYTLSGLREQNRAYFHGLAQLRSTFTEYLAEEQLHHFTLSGGEHTDDRPLGRDDRIKLDPPENIMRAVVSERSFIRFAPS